MNLLGMGIAILTVFNGIESFWSFTKRRLAKFNGVSVNFELHLKESEWRWKKQSDELASELWQFIRYY
jgi:transposase